MSSNKFSRIVLALTAFAALGATTDLFAQDGDVPAAKKSPLAARSIRPFMRSETPANKAPDLYDKSSDEFDYFREELGRTETSTKTKKRLQEIENRVVYADPMEAPAYDGTPFVNIYDDILVDDKPFLDPDDPDVKYAPDENNILQRAADFCALTTASISALTGVSSGSSAGGVSMGSGSEEGAPYPMPDDVMTQLPGEGGVSMSGSGTKKADVAPSKNDDSNLIFPKKADNPENANNPYKATYTPIADEAFDFFKADRAFKPAPPKTNSQYGSGSDMPPMMVEP